jgi:type II secretory pathway pseudopilin PulG
MIGIVISIVLGVLAIVLPPVISKRQARKERAQRLQLIKDALTRNGSVSQGTSLCNGRFDVPTVFIRNPTTHEFSVLEVTFLTSSACRVNLNPIKTETFKGGLASMANWSGPITVSPGDEKLFVWMGSPAELDGAEDIVVSYAVKIGDETVPEEVIVPRSAEIRWKRQSSEYQKPHEKRGFKSSTLFCGFSPTGRVVLSRLSTAGL